MTSLDFEATTKLLCLASLVFTLILHDVFTFLFKDIKHFTATQIPMECMFGICTQHDMHQSISIKLVDYFHICWLEPAFCAQAARWLLERGANSTFSNSFGATALMQAAHYGGPANLVISVCHFIIPAFKILTLSAYCSFSWLMHAHTSCSGRRHVRTWGKDSHNQIHHAVFLEWDQNSAVSIHSTRILSVSQKHTHQGHVAF